MTSKRMEFGGKDGPGPGDYEAYKQPQTVVEHAHIRNTDKTHFESNIPRYNDQIVHDAERMVSENRRTLGVSDIILIVRRLIRHYLGFVS